MAGILWSSDPFVAFLSLVDLTVVVAEQSQVCASRDPFDAASWGEYVENDALWGHARDTQTQALYSR